MKVAGGWIGEPRDERRGGVGRERSRSSVESGDGFIRKIVADQAAGRDVAIFDGVGVGAGQIQGVVVHLRSGGRFKADAGAGVTPGDAIVGNKIILDLPADMSRSRAIAECDRPVAIEKKVIRDHRAAGRSVEVDRWFRRGGRASTGLGRRAR